MLTLVDRDRDNLAEGNLASAFGRLDNSNRLGGNVPVEGGLTHTEYPRSHCTANGWTDQSLEILLHVGDGVVAAREHGETQRDDVAQKSLLIHLHGHIGSLI